MIRVGITGVDGLIGWQLRCFLKGHLDTQAIPANRVTFTSPDLLAEFVSSVDAIVHLAGMSRGTDLEITTTNVALSQALINACEQTKCRPHILFASSTHAVSLANGKINSAYSQSKRECTRLFQEWAIRNQALYTNLIVPHVFGEHGKPFYSSVVSTFCHQLAVGEVPTIINDEELDLIHAQRVAQNILGLIRAQRTGDVAIPGTPMTVSALLAKISGFAEQYRGQIMPNLSNEMDLFLFNTYRSYLYPKHYPATATLYCDNRGSLFEAIKSRNGGQSFISTTWPGITRGNHFHTSKVERFCVISGEAVIRIRKLFSDKVEEFFVSGIKPQYIDIPTLHTHNITNTGKSELITLFWAHEIYDKAFPDTISEPV